MMTRLISFLCLLVCYIHATSNEGGNTLLDDSEYQRLVKFDEMLEESVKSLASKKPEDFQPTSIADSVVLNYANVAMMYYQRNERWKQGGHAESLQYISLAIAAHSNANDAAHSDKTLYRSMMLHKARMLASLGRRKSALSILNALLEMYESNNADKNGDAKTSHWWTWYGSAKLKASSSTMSKQELSDVLYRKAELILTLFDDFQSAVDLFRRALESYPCHYLAHLQLIQALKATKSATREVWQAEIERMEEYLLNVRQRPRRTMKHVHKYSAPLIDYQQPIPRHDVNTIMDYSSIASILRSVHNNVHYLYDMLLAPTTEVVCTFSHSQSADSSSGLYAHISPVRTVTSLNSIHASLNWALFQAADSILSTSASTSGEEEEEDEEEVRGVAWKYLQQARHFDRLRINEQYEMQEYQQATLRGNEESEDREEDINKGGAPDLNDDLSLEERADREALLRSAAQTQHLVSFFQKGYWGDPDSDSQGGDNDGRGDSDVENVNDASPSDREKSTWSRDMSRDSQTDGAATTTTVEADSQSQSDRIKPPLSVGPSVGELQRQGSKTRIPIFIVGFFRSGSTLLEGLLESHSGFQWSAEDKTKSSMESGESESERAAESLGFSRKAVWGMGEDSPFVFEMYAMQEETLAAYAKLEEQKKELQTNAPGKKKAKNKKSTTDLEHDFVATYRRIIDRKASTIVGKMLQRFVHYHGSDSVAKNATHAAAAPAVCFTDDGAVGAGEGNTCANYAPPSFDSTINNSDSSVAQSPPLPLPLPLRIVDKMLTNYVNIGLIHLVFPRAIILHPVRDPLDTLFSCYANRFGDPSAAYTLHLHSLVLKYVHYLEVMQHFRNVLPYYSLPEKGTKSSSSVGKSGLKKGKKGENATRRIQALVDVRYEELVANPERTLKHLLENVLGVPYVPPVKKTTAAAAAARNDKANQTSSTEVGREAEGSSNLKDGAYVRVVQTASRLQVKEPVYRSSVGRWRRYAAQLQQTLVPALRAHLPRLAALQALPYLAHNSSLARAAQQQGRGDEKQNVNSAAKCSRKNRNCVFMNWDLDPLFDYENMVNNLK